MTKNTMTEGPERFLKLRRVATDTYRENVAYLHQNCPVYRSEGFQALSKVGINAAADGQRVLAVLNVVDDERICGVNEPGLSEQAFEQLDIDEGEAVCVAQAEPPASLHRVHRKIAGERLGYKDYLSIARDVVANRYSKMEMAAFLVACAEAGLER